ncbi:competence/damage-inducible protein A [Methylomarinum vadi]|uniref:competence/damage-inducible protein A n=1 Tax=Methylomarinum vadi TaxID=438855 RepID=UPI0004DF7B82|nr:molybdopterin-binding protein [Methylomarinum vadi]
MKPIAEIFSQGEEVVGGHIVDSNAAWLSQQLVEMGFAVKRHSAVGDDIEDLKQLLSEIAERANCCICTGGLGPTVDDLTSQAVAEAFERPLQFDEEALAQIRQYYVRRDRDMVEANRKQAFLPQGAVRIDNHWGTAPGFSLQQRRCRFFFLPGVPYEMKHLFNESIAPTLQQNFTLQPDTLVTLKTVGVGESDIQQKLTGLDLPAQVQLGFRANPEEVQTKLLFPAGFDRQTMAQCVTKAKAFIGDYVFAVDGLEGEQGGLVDVIDELMQRKKLSLSVLETASQGMVAAKCVGRPWLRSALFRNSLKAIAVDMEVEPDSSDIMQIAATCARQLQQREGCDLALVQLYRGAPEQFRDKDSSIDLYNVLLTPDGLYRSQLSTGGAQHRKQNQSAILALDLLRRYLQNKCL